WIPCPAPRRRNRPRPAGRRDPHPPTARGSCWPRRTPQATPPPTPAAPPCQPPDVRYRGARKYTLRAKAQARERAQGAVGTAVPTLWNACYNEGAMDDWVEIQADPEH